MNIKLYIKVGALSGWCRSDLHCCYV